MQANPLLLPDDHDIFICGDDRKAKAEVTKILKTFGWKTVIDLSAT